MTAPVRLRTDMLVEETRPKAGFASADISTAFSKIPLVDYRLKDANPAQFHADLRYAMAEVGFMLLENVPGFDAEFQAKVLQQGHDFFGLDDAEKLKTDIRRDPHFRGCARQDRVKDVRLNVNIESYHFGYEFEESTDPAAPLWKRVLNGPNQWPDPKVLPEFRPTVKEYFARCESLGRDLFKGICRMLGADEGHATRYWTDLKDESALYFLGNLNFYPPYSSIPPERRQEVERGFVRGLNAHRDFHTWLSILIQDESGLEVLSHDGKWIDVPVIPGTVVVNTGSMLMEATNGALPATIHRVNSLKVRKPRMTAPYFLMPPMDLPILPIPSTLPRKYAQADPSVVLANSISDPSLRWVHRRMATLYRNAETFWPKEWALLNELLAASKRVYLLQGRLKKELVDADTDTEEWRKAML